MRVFSENTAREVRAMLELAVGAEGTGTAARVADYRVAGKTGTVRKLTANGYSESHYVAWFAGLAPATNPRLVMVVAVDDPSRGGYFGGSVAAPVFSRVMAGALRLLDIAPDAPREETHRILTVRNERVARMMPATRIKPLHQLLAGLADVSSSPDCEVRGLASDSRQVAPGDLFLAMPGLRVDGRDYIHDAAARRRGGGVRGRRPTAAAGGGASDSARGFAAARRPDRRPLLRCPSRDLVVIGVTGTNGKTTCTQLLAQTLDRCAVIGTLGYGFPGALDASLHTTPDALSVHRLLDRFRDAGARHAAMEVSSHALAQGRVTAVRFKAAVFTNLTRDHLDYHGDMEFYGAAKAGLFDMPTRDRRHQPR